MADQVSSVFNEIMNGVGLWCSRTDAGRPLGERPRQFVNNLALGHHRSQNAPRSRRAIGGRETRQQMVNFEIGNRQICCDHHGCLTTSRRARTDLHAWVEAERPRLLSAALTVLRSYLRVGMPEMKLPPWGSYEAWSRVERGAVVWSGMCDPWRARRGLQDNHGDDQIAAMGGLLRLWHTVDHQGEGSTVGNLVKRIDGLGEGNSQAELLLALAGPEPREDKTDRRVRILGYLIRQFAGRVIGGRRLVKAGVSAGLTRWRVGIPAAST